MGITADQFKSKAIKEVLIPGFEVGDEPIPIKVRTLNMMSIVGNKSIPNSLMASVQKVFKLGGASQEKAEEMALDNIESLVELLVYICDKAMVEPKYSEVGEYLTQEQMMAIFNFTQGTVNTLMPFRNE